jgi:hypothetical protein
MSDFLLLENGSYLLQETGFKIILDETAFISKSVSDTGHGNDVISLFFATFINLSDSGSGNEEFDVLNKNVPSVYQVFAGIKDVIPYSIED